MRDYSDYETIRAAVARVMDAATPFKGTLYRACDPAYANTRDLLTGEGSGRFGGRWNAPGRFRLVYLSMGLGGAVAEAIGVTSLYGFDPADRLPLTIVAVDAVLERVLDLTDGRVRKAIGFTMTAMAAGDWKGANAEGREAATQAIGRASFELGLQAIIVPSAAKRGVRNCNVLPNHVSKPSHLTIRGADRLSPPGTTDKTRRTS